MPNTPRSHQERRRTRSGLKGAFFTDDYVQNVGDTDMQFIAVFRTPNFQEMNLSDWLKHSPAEMVAEHLNVDPAIVPQWPGANAFILPG